MALIRIRSVVRRAELTRRKDQKLSPYTPRKPLHTQVSAKYHNGCAFLPVAKRSQVRSVSTKPGAASKSLIVSVPSD